MKTLSVVTVVRNAQDTLADTLQSIVTQTVFASQIELIVIDGASTDGTPAILERFRPQIDTLVSEPDKGIFDAMNKGAHLATAPWILFLNAGDAFYEPQTVEHLLLDETPADHILYGDHVTYSANGSHKSCLAIPFWEHPKIIMGMGICHQSIYMPTVWVQAHPFKYTEYPIAADFELVYTYYQQGVRFQYIQRPLCLYEVGTGNSSRPEKWEALLKENACIVGRMGSWEYYKMLIRHRLHLD